MLIRHVSLSLIVFNSLFMHGYIYLKDFFLLATKQYADKKNSI